MMQAPIAGYHLCPCQDCFEIAIGQVSEEDESPAFCSDCEEAGCEGKDSDCQCEYTYEEVNDNDGL